jgi:hypothetical protein
LKKQIQNVEKDPTDVDSPISVAIDTKGLTVSGKPTEKLINRILESVENMQHQIDRISSIQNAALTPMPAMSPFGGLAPSAKSPFATGTVWGPFSGDITLTQPTWAVTPLAPIISLQYGSDILTGKPLPQPTSPAIPPTPESQPEDVRTDPPKPSQYKKSASKPKNNTSKTHPVHQEDVKDKRKK